MQAFVLVPGAGGDAWYWHRVVSELSARGYGAIAVDLPGPDSTAGLPEYAAKTVAAVGAREDVVVVAQSLGGFSAPMACSLVKVQMLVLVNAMIPTPGEQPGQWWDNTGAAAARVAAAEAGGYPAEFDLATYFLHDVPGDVLAGSEGQAREEADIAFSQPCDIARWPDVATRVVAGRDDRFFPLDFQRRVAGQRLGLDVDVVPGGHLCALSRSQELAAQLISYL